MKPETLHRAKIHATLGAVAMAVLLLAPASTARADDATRILKSMTEYLGSQQSLSASFDSDVEIITPELQKIQFASSGQMKLSRPDKLRVRRTGGFADVGLVYYGKKGSIYGRKAETHLPGGGPGRGVQKVEAMQERALFWIAGNHPLLL